MKPLRFLGLLILLATGCATEGADSGSDSADFGGKGDAWDSPFAAEAKAYAEAFDFEANSPTLVDRDVAAETGPTWVRRAYALHFAWEENDLGSARLYKWKVGQRRVWAIRTSTDGDETFVELFNADGDWLATGVSGYDETPEGFVKVIHWDATPGAMRNEICPPDITSEVEFYLRQFNALITSVGAGVSLTESLELAEVLFAGQPSTGSVDGWERAAVLRTLADPSIAWSSPARSHANKILAFYQDDYANLGSVTTPSIATTIGLPSSLAQEVRFARATNHDGVDAVGHRTMNLLAQGLGAFAGSAVPAKSEALHEALVEAGASSSDATQAIKAIGADSSQARIWVGNTFEFNDDFWPLQLPGTAWFVSTPSKKFVSYLHIGADDDLTVWNARAEEAVAVATGVEQTAKVIQVRERASETYVDLEYTRPDQGMLGVVIAVPVDADASPRAWIRSYSPSIDPELRASIGNLITEVVGVANVDVLGALRPSSGEPFAVYRHGVSAQPQLVRANFADNEVDPLAPTALTNAQLEGLALILARHHAETMVAEHGNLPLLEVLLRTAWVTPSDLDETEASEAADSPVGFDPATEAAQFMLGSVWGDNAVFVTFANDGTVRVEDFN